MTAVVTERPPGIPEEDGAGIPAARRFRPGRWVAAAALSVLVAAGWAWGRLLLVTGFVLGRIWRTAAFCAEAVSYGFRMGAGLPVAGEEAEPAPGGAEPPRPSKL